MNAKLIPIEKINVGDDVERGSARVEDDALRKSIEAGGIQQPLVVLSDGDGFMLVDGLRRLRVARVLGIGKVPAVVDVPPAGVSPTDYRRQVRFILDEHRQDLVPSQKAELIETLKRMFGMTNRQVAAYLGIDADSVTNWLSVKQFIPPVVNALDAGLLTMRASRALIGMTEEGQQKVWKSEARLLLGGGTNVHKEVRAKYSPQSFPQYYRDAENITARLERTKGKGKRKAKARGPSLGTADEKRRLLNSLEMKEAEQRDGQEELKQLKRECIAAGPIVAAILRNPELRAAAEVIGGAPMIEELDVFSEHY